MSGRWITQSIEDEVTAALQKERDAGNSITVCIGTDSQVKARANGRGKITEFATVIVFVRKGKGAFMYISNETCTRNMSIKEGCWMKCREALK